MEPRQVLGGEAHRAGGLGVRLRGERVRVEAVGHRHVAHVLDAAHEEDLAVAGHHGHRGVVERASSTSRTAGSRSARSPPSGSASAAARSGRRCRPARASAARSPRRCRRSRPGSSSGLRREQRLHHLGRERVGPHVAEHPALGAPHRGAHGVDDDHVPHRVTPRGSPCRRRRGRKAARSARRGHRASGASRRPAAASPAPSASAQRKIPPRKGGKPSPLTSATSTSTGVATILSSRQREDSSSIGSIVRSTISSSGSSARWRSRTTSAFASGSLCLLGGPFFSGFQA